jgi:inorganic triphosphatase YgiF
LVSTYFDTAKHKLRRHGLSLRIRHIGDRHIQTIKTATGSQLGRGEWETEIAGNKPDLGKIDGTPLERFASKKLRRELGPIFRTSVRRVTVPIHMRSSEIELAVDRGQLTAGRRSSPIEELELELKNGHPDDLFHLARSVERTAAAELYFKTKAQRGYSLANGEKDVAVYAEPIALRDDISVGEAFRIIARSTVRHFAANTDAVRNLDPEGIHQMRVGLRRLRAAISLFSLADERTEEIKTELKWLTNELAPAREIDIFIKQKITAAKDLVPRRGGTAIEKEFAARRAVAFERARRAVASDRCRTLLVDVVEWIETVQSDAWKSSSIGKFASDILHRRVKKLRKVGPELERLSPRDRHKFRIRTKKVRYATQFFESLFPDKHDQKQLARLSGHLKPIQDALGSLNDFIAHQKMAAEAALEAPADNRRARAFTSGIILGREDEAVKPLMKAALREVRRLRQVKTPFG